jgi:hypothetical protein
MHRSFTSTGTKIDPTVIGVCWGISSCEIPILHDSNGKNFFFFNFVIFLCWLLREEHTVFPLWIKWRCWFFSTFFFYFCKRKVARQKAIIYWPNILAKSFLHISPCWICKKRSLLDLIKYFYCVHIFSILVNDLP